MKKKTKKRKRKQKLIFNGVEYGAIKISFNPYLLTGEELEKTVNKRKQY